MSKYDAIVNSAYNIAARELLRREMNEQKADEREALKLWRSDVRCVSKINKVNIDKYRVLKVNFNALVGRWAKAKIATMQAMDKSNPESIDEGRMAYRELVDHFNTAKFTVKVNDCRIEMTSRSLASDIAGVAYGRTTDKIIVVNHGVINNLVVDKVLLGGTASQGEQMIDALSQLILDKLVNNGISIEYDADTTLTYKVWAATSSQQKTGAVYCGEVNMMKSRATAINYGVAMSDIIASGKDTGSEFLKRQALLFTPSIPYVNATLNDVIMLNDIEIDRVVPFALRIGMDATAKFVRNELYSNLTGGLKTMVDGMIMSETIPSSQMRGFGIKGLNLNIEGMPEELKKRLGLEFNMIKDIEGNLVSYDSTKIIMTKSCWKGAKLPVTWSKFVEKANELAITIPYINCLRIVRYSDSTEDHKRTLSRQSNQQFMFATDAQLNKLLRGEIAKLNAEKRLDGALVNFANLTANDKERTALNRLFELNPSILASDKMDQLRKQRWDSDFADVASGRVTVHGSYPYIAMDPVAFLQIVLFGYDPADEQNLGLLAANEINCSELRNGQQVYGVRYPNNHLCGQILTNKADDIYRCCGDVCIISYRGFVIDAYDGDFDGDEMSIITDKIVINMMKDTLDKVRVPLIVFAHEKAKAKPGLSMAKQVSIALFNGMKYNRVGMYSNLATKLIHAMSLAEDRETKNNLFVDAAFAHVGTILVIDMIKTGFMPAAIEEKLNTLKKNFKKMPWNQRFNRHETEKPHDDAAWDEETQSETNDVCDRMARIILNNTNGYTFDKMGIEFDADVMLAHRDDLPNNISKGTLNNLWFTRLNLANFAEDDKAVIKAVREGKEIGPKDLMKFFWQNYASLSRTMSVDTSAEKRIAQCKAYLDMARSCIMELPKSSTRWATYTEEQQRLGIVNVFLRDAFELSSHGNGIDNLKKGSYAYFVLSVFAEDILRNVEENLNLPDEERWAVIQAASRNTCEGEDLFDVPPYTDEELTAMCDEIA